jgi:hypothetical protein
VTNLLEYLWYACCAVGGVAVGLHFWLLSAIVVVTGLGVLLVLDRKERNHERILHE